ncbi:hypothetical protein KM043_016256 [Ampulex compressa]|nr:hypothetical protein KM043_016256 [Ampulex compressa]
MPDGEEREREDGFSVAVVFLWEARNFLRRAARRKEEDRRASWRTALCDSGGGKKKEQGEERESVGKRWAFGTGLNADGRRKRGRRRRMRGAWVYLRLPFPATLSLSAVSPLAHAARPLSTDGLSHRADSQAEGFRAFSLRSLTPFRSSRLEDAPKSRPLSRGTGQALSPESSKDAGAAEV